PRRPPGPPGPARRWSTVRTPQSAAPPPRRSAPTPISAWSSASLLLLAAHDFARSFVAADDFNGRQIRVSLSHLDRDGQRPRGLADRWRPAEEHRRTNALGLGVLLVERVAQRELNLAFIGGQRQALGFVGIDEQRHDVHRNRLFLLRGGARLW